ncbi:fumarylacetoacetate hydrolase family protein [Pseudomarimonas arenosa]|uniref:Fumarylacetoacetate hydrolase family protein n=1 Tax=Pseudomarimonas arenosa TaxID=2774145 RepID=A0AAW3ZD00_9GAMM|nr:fumarylacetoacetate hydrolase family protein [Pseudomarimonas arenosa]MBD8524235.1 fumarylacetoacetate hydrolase family protein [Pseudomarimonas arenosa]
MNTLFPPAPAVLVPIAGSEQSFPVRRVFCVGRNYAEHAREMGMPVERNSPIFFCKPADALVLPGHDPHYPSATQDVHHEVEWVLAIGASVPLDSSPKEAISAVIGHAIGLDLTRRDLQAGAKQKGQPWDTAKAFDESAPISALTLCPGDALPTSGALWLEVNGDLRQQGDLSDMLMTPAEIVAELSRLFALKPGDLIFTGTPAGVSALQPGDHWRAGLGDQCLMQGQMLPRR